ncbi:uncharacterized protein LOC142524814 isoform X1 [Primulina tabacum]|uniref:uncharacterized protein LOC142524814 isoform X1 n=1 Tax=Primulina tabacum TaxID=48773 RepID=UPI003F5A6B61
MSLIILHMHMRVLERSRRALLDRMISKDELLSMVRKHSKLIGKTVLDEEETSDVEMDSGFWRDVIDLYFVHGRVSRGRQDDDLIFFVRKMSVPGQKLTENVETNSPYFVRRWASKLDELLGQNSEDVDWRRSFYLNLIAHTSFSVTVAICSHQVLQQYQSSQGRPLTPIYKVVKTVYASPSRINFHLDSRKEVETMSAYPDICFAVDDFDSTFDAVTIAIVYCLMPMMGQHFLAKIWSNLAVVLVFLPQRLSTVLEREQTPSYYGLWLQITLFSGFVSYQMVREAYDAGRTGFGNILSLGHSSGKTDRIYMKGPGGRGEVEVAVFGVLDRSKIESGPHSPIQISKKGLGIGTMVRTAASVASMAAKHAYAAASANRPSEEEMVPLNCRLMSVSLPWEHIAQDLLFKGSPPVNL